jgi:3-methyladenine DNA glycosylase AlkC
VAEALKTFFDAAYVRRLAASIAPVHPRFPKAAFIRTATRGLNELELLDRARHVATALAETLPKDYPSALDVLLRSLGPEHETDELLGLGMAPFFYMPHVLFVAAYGLDHFDLSMRAQVELTKRFSAETSVRFYIERDPESAFEYFERFARDRNPHVRRLVSEGTRARLPWARRVAFLDERPERVLELLEILRDDPASLVRRSVANNLNDLGKIRPELLFATCRRWMRGAPPERRALVEHALRSAVKLAILGFGAKVDVVVDDASISPKRPRIGEKATLEATVRNVGRARADVLVDFVVRFVKASGRTSPKTFKGGRASLDPGAVASFRAVVSLAEHTTRTPREGRNGSARPFGSFHVVAAPPRRS